MRRRFALGAWLLLLHSGKGVDKRASPLASTAAKRRHDRSDPRPSRCTIERRPDLSAAQFLAEFEGRAPVVVPLSAAALPALREQWSVEGVLETAGHATQVGVGTARTIVRGDRVQSGTGMMTAPLHNFVADMKAALRLRQGRESPTGAAEALASNHDEEVAKIRGTPYVYDSAAMATQRAAVTAAIPAFLFSDNDTGTIRHRRRPNRTFWTMGAAGSGLLFHAHGSGCFAHLHGPLVGSGVCSRLVCPQVARLLVCLHAHARPHTVGAVPARGRSTGRSDRVSIRAWRG